MKILMPYKPDGGFEVGQDKVTGGIEKFITDVHNNFPDIVHVKLPIGWDKIDGKNRKQIMLEAIAKHKPDIIFLNSIELASGMIRYEIPIVCVFHIGVQRGITLLSSTPQLKKLTDAGHHVYFVSEHQHNWWRTESKRLKCEFGDITGYINPSYFESHDYSFPEQEYDVGTIGRCVILKKPFLAHEKSVNNMSSLVITMRCTDPESVEYKYYQKNTDWEAPQTTVWNLPHDQVMTTIAKARTYCSTCTDESWGITALEALGHGVPIVLLCDKSMLHASEVIPADPSHYAKVSVKCTPEEFKEAVDSLKGLDRQEIARATREKHSLDNWKKSIEDMFEVRANDKNMHNLSNFF